MVKTLVIIIGIAKVVSPNLFKEGIRQYFFTAKFLVSEHFWLTLETKEIG